MRSEHLPLAITFSIVGMERLYLRAISLLTLVLLYSIESLLFCFAVRSFVFPFFILINLLQIYIVYCCKKKIYFFKLFFGGIVLMSIFAISN